MLTGKGLRLWTRSVHLQQLTFYRRLPDLPQETIKKEKAEKRKEPSATAIARARARLEAEAAAALRIEATKAQALAKREEEKREKALQKLVKQLRPKRAPAAWGFFLAERLSLARRPDQSAAALVPEIARAWRETAAPARVPYEQRSQQANAEYKIVRDVYRQMFAPKRPASPFASFLKEKYHTAQGTGPERAREITLLWRALSAAEKAARTEEYSARHKAHLAARARMTELSPEQLAEQWARWLAGQGFQYYRSTDRGDTGEQRREQSRKNLRKAPMGEAS